MPNAFNFSASPFDCLTQAEQRLVRDSVDVAYFPEGAAILEVGIAPTHLFVIIKGYVSQMEGSEVITSYGPDDCFDGRGLVAGKVVAAPDLSLGADPRGLRVSGPGDLAEEEALLACEELRPWMRREFGWPLVELGNVRLRMGDLEGAEAAYRRALERGAEIAHLGIDHFVADLFGRNLWR